jgi:hypothetical protein
MTVAPSIEPSRLLEEQLAQASPDLLRELLTMFINTLMSAEADAVRGAAYGQASPKRTNPRSGTGVGSSTPGPGPGAGGAQAPGRDVPRRRWPSPNS